MIFNSLQRSTKCRYILYRCYSQLRINLVVMKLLMKSQVVAFWQTDRLSHHDISCKGRRENGDRSGQLVTPQHNSVSSRESVKKNPTLSWLVIRHLLRGQLLLRWYRRQQRVRVRVMIGFLVWGRVRIKIRIRVRVTFNVRVYHRHDRSNYCRRSKCRTFLSTL